MDRRDFIRQHKSSAASQQQGILSEAAVSAPSALSSHRTGARDLKSPPLRHVAQHAAAAISSRNSSSCKRRLYRARIQQLRTRPVADQERIAELVTAQDADGLFVAHTIVGTNRNPERQAGRRSSVSHESANRSRRQALNANWMTVPGAARTTRHDSNCIVIDTLRKAGGDPRATRPGDGARDAERHQPPGVLHALRAGLLIARPSHPSSNCVRHVPSQITEGNIIPTERRWYRSRSPGRDNPCRNDLHRERLSQHLPHIRSKGSRGLGMEQGHSKRGKEGERGD